MKIETMMAEIRMTHPNASVSVYGEGWPVMVRTYEGKTIGKGATQHKAVTAAYRAVRKARPKPMTVAEAKAFVLSRHPKATWGALSYNPTGKRPWVYIWDGEWNTDVRWGKGETIGQAWKAAAAAITKQEQSA